MEDLPVTLNDVTCFPPNFSTQLLSSGEPEIKAKFSSAITKDVSLSLVATFFPLFGCCAIIHNTMGRTTVGVGFLAQMSNITMTFLFYSPTTLSNQCWNYGGASALGKRAQNSSFLPCLSQALPCTGATSCLSWQVPLPNPPQVK